MNEDARRARWTVRGVALLTFFLVSLDFFRRHWFLSLIGGIEEIFGGNFLTTVLRYE